MDPGPTVKRGEPLPRLGRYELLRVLGKGAMGVVYEAIDPRLGRTVAIKTILKSHLIDDGTAQEYSRRFETEAQAAARLNHPHIVTVFDFGEQDDIAYIVMEFVRGRELAQAFADGEPFTLSDAVRIMGELLDALAFAHARSVVHRDVKPANVMLDSGGRVKLTDFGVARVASTLSDRTMPGTLVGTPSYMAPEQILGTAVGSRADLFAAGVILFQFLTGQRPFSGGGAFAIQRKIVADPVTPPTTLNPALPTRFDRIIERALAKDPEHRYESAEDFATDLRQALAAAQTHELDLELFDDERSEPVGGSLRLPRQLRQGTDATPAPPLPASPPPVPVPVRATIDDDATLPPAPAPRAPQTQPSPPSPAAQPPRPDPSPVPSPAMPAAKPERQRWIWMVAPAIVALVGLVWWLMPPSRPARILPPPSPMASAPLPAPPPSPIDTTVEPAPVRQPIASTPLASAPTAPSLSRSPAAGSSPAATRRRDEARVPANAAASAATGSDVERRCSELLQRLQLGEQLSAEQSLTYRRECTQR
jgi:serine/threonine protein kinase